MGKTRLEAFSDGVIAIIITIMVLELKVPHNTDFQSLTPLLPVFLSYVLSFVHIGIYWNNHHHMVHTVKQVTAGILWANLHLLFWLSLSPFATGWMGENHFAALPTALYGFILLMACLAYFILQKCIIASQGAGSILAKAIGNDIKDKFTVMLYITAMLSAIFLPWVAVFIYSFVALIWLVPDKRIEVLFAE